MTHSPTTPANPAQVTDAIRGIVEDALNSAIPEPWEVAEHATQRILAAIGGGQAVDVEAIARVVDPAAWADDLPVPTRADTIQFHERRQASCETARRILSALSQPHPADERVVEPDGVSLIAAERRRQIEAEGWSSERDDAYRDGELARAGGIYAVIAGADLTTFRNAKDGYSLNDVLQSLMVHYWPWDKSWLKVTSRQRSLEKAGACIAAEIDRLLRLSATEGRKNG